MLSMSCMQISTISIATRYTMDYEKLSVMDKWLLSKMNTMVKAVDKNLESLPDPRGSQMLSRISWTI